MGENLPTFNDYAIQKPLSTMGKKKRGGTQACGLTPFGLSDTSCAAARLSCNRQGSPLPHVSMAFRRGIRACDPFAHRTFAMCEICITSAEWRTPLVFSYRRLIWCHSCASRNPEFQGIRKNWTAAPRRNGQWCHSAEVLPKSLFLL